MEKGISVEQYSIIDSKGLKASGQGVWDLDCELREREEGGVSGNPEKLTQGRDQRCLWSPGCQIGVPELEGAGEWDPEALKSSEGESPSYGRTGEF